MTGSLPYHVNTETSELLQAVRELVDEDLPGYSDILRDAFGEVDPRTGYCA